MSHNRTREEDGASLVFVLIFITVFGLILAALLTESSASMRFSSAVKTQESKLYAADAGVSVAIQQVRQNNELCPEPGAVSTVPISTTINDMTVDVTCTGTTGSTLGAGGYAVMVRNSTTGVVGELHTQLGAGAEKIIEGPVFVEGDLDLKANLTVKKGRFYHKGSSCTGSPPANLLIPPGAGYSYLCTGNAPALPGNTPPNVTLTVANSNPTAVAGCKTFLPGVYTSKPVLGTDNYFVSGVYYFNFTDPDDNFEVFDGEYVFGGKKGDGEDRSLTDAVLAPHTVPACATGGDPAGYYGSGVKFIFGKNSGLDVDKGHIELFARQDDAAHVGASGTNGTSIVALPNECVVLPAVNCPEATAWTAWATAQPVVGPKPASAVSTQITDVKHLTDSDLVLHGLIYARNQNVTLGAKSSSLAQAFGGVVANDVHLLATPHVSGMAVSVVGGHPHPRHVKLKATVTVAGNKPVESTAIIELPNDIVTPAILHSWRTRGIPDIL